MQVDSLSSPEAQSRGGGSQLTARRCRGDAAEQGLTLLSGRDVMLSLWYSDSQLKDGSPVNSDNFDVTDLRL